VNAIYLDEETDLAFLVELHYILCFIPARFNFRVIQFTGRLIPVPLCQLTIESNGWNQLVNGCDSCGNFNLKMNHLLL
jgi:hypothetical protein